MSMKYLGERFDIHCGGTDHIKVHHTNEIAQAQGATGSEPVRYWMHGEFLVIQKEKMSKSEGNFITLQTIKEKGFEPLSYRYLGLTAHYRSLLNFTWESLQAAQTGLYGLRAFYFRNYYGSIRTESRIQDNAQVSLMVQNLEKEFREKVNDDLNMPAALTVLFKFADAVDNLMGKNGISHHDFNHIWAVLQKVDAVLGLALSDTKRYQPELNSSYANEMTQKRRMYRREKLWAESDKIRDQLLKNNYEIKDSPYGTEVRHLPSGVCRFILDKEKDVSKFIRPAGHIIEN